MRCHLSTFLHPEALGWALGPTKLFFRAVSPFCESSKDVRDPVGFRPCGEGGGPSGEPLHGTPASFHGGLLGDPLSSLQRQT